MEALIEHLGGRESITNAALGVTVTDNGTDGHVICAYGEDRLGNGPQNEPVSYYFGKDVLAPQARIHGRTAALPGLSGTFLPALYHVVQRTLVPPIPVPYLPANAAVVNGRHLRRAASFGCE